MNILFRADSSSNIGTGHIMRDLVLAQQFPHAKIVFATQDLNGNINHKIVESGYEIINLKSNEKDELVKLLKKWHVDLLVIDHYHIDYKYESYIKENFDVKILAFDDTYEKHNCDILLNHNIYADSSIYKTLVPKNCELRCGGSFTLLRDEFRYEKIKHRKPIQASKNIFIAMGGTDHSNLNIEILKVLENFPNIHANVVTTTANQYLKELQEYVADKDHVTLHININHIAKLMNESDFAIVTPSVTGNEIVYMAVPFIAIQTTFNQSYMTKYLIQENYPVLEHFDANALFRLFNNLICSDASETVNLITGSR